MPLESTLSVGWGIIERPKGIYAWPRIEVEGKYLIP